MFDIQNNAYTDIIFLYSFLLHYIMYHTDFLKKQCNILFIKNSLELIFLKNVTIN